jgi:homoserine dehydrogenase
VRDHELTVLKFGGSVLRTEGDLATAVGEIRYWLHNKSPVIAVVSAIGDTTEKLLEQVHRYGETPDETAQAALVATGEQISSALLVLALGKAGIRAGLLDPRRIGLEADGPLLDARLRAVDVERVRTLLSELPVGVVPGFIACGTNGCTALLGRGGSDFTALFLAHELRADRCRLIKDVDGLYEADPNVWEGKSNPPKRYRCIRWQDALLLGGGVIQDKALRFAAEHGLSFEISEAIGNEGTHVGNHDTRLYGSHSENSQAPRN